MSLSAGQVLNNRYRIVGLIAQGGFGAVYRAWDLNLQMVCAVKENFETSLQAQNQFQREASILAKLNHPNLVRVIDHFFISNQGQYLVMDVVEGEDLQTMLDRTGMPLPESQVIDWIGQICDALTHIHSQIPPIIHRDIKPANIRVTPQGKAMLVDFGIAKVYDPSALHPSLTQSGARGVTPGFSSPEQYSGGGRTNACSDIYSLGATFYYLLTSQVPVESIQLIQGTPLISPRHYNSAITPFIEQTILRAMVLDPQKRFQTAQDFKNSLYMNASSIPSRPTGQLVSPPPLPRYQPAQIKIPLRLTPEDAMKKLFAGHVSRNAILRELKQAMLHPRPTTGKIVVLVGDEGSGTSTIIDAIWEEISNQKNTQMANSVDLRNASDLISAVTSITLAISDLQSPTALKNNFGRDQKTTFKLSLPFVINLAPFLPMTIGDKPFEVGYEDHKKSENNASPDDSPAPDKVEKQYLDALQNLVKTIKSKNKKASVAFLLDKVADEKIVEVILPILRTSGVIGVLVVDKANYSQWKLRTLDTEVRYIPRIWNMGGDLLKLMVDKNPEADRAIFYQLVNYLDFMSEGLPKKLAKAVSERCIDLPSSKKGWWPKKPEMQPYLCITEDISTRIAGVGDLHREVTKQIDTIIACINPSPSPETRDAILSSTYATLAWIVDNLDAGKRKFKFKDFVAELQNNGIPTNDKKVVEQVASTIIEALIVQKRIVRRKTDLDASGIFELQES